MQVVQVGMETWRSGWNLAPEGAGEPMDLDVVLDGVQHAQNEADAWQAAAPSLPGEPIGHPQTTWQSIDGSLGTRPD